MTESMVEKVARAIAHSHGSKITGPSRHRASDEFGWDPSHAYMQKYIDAHWKEHVHAATFAISAMREPTQQMRLAGIAEWSRPDPTPEHESTLVFNAVWRAMIDATLKEQEKVG